MRTNISIVVAAYVRLSVDEAGKSVSGSIENQISLIKEYCAKRELIVAAVFQDDGWSGGNFERPGFKKLLEFLRKKSANTVITVDLSRLGRNMREASYYAEEYFPEHGIHFFTISDGFDTARENVFAPFQFAMNEVYLRDGSRKVKNVLKNKRESGQYCACPPYGYKKNPDNVHQLIPDEVTAPVVQRIFAAAASGDSSRKIASCIAIILATRAPATPLIFGIIRRSSGSSRMRSISGIRCLAKRERPASVPKRSSPSRRRIGQSRAARICRLFRRRHLTLRR